MKDKIKTKVQNLSQNPKVKVAVTSMKPDRTIWGFIGVVGFFILPEIIAFNWGKELTSYAKEALPFASVISTYYYDFLVMMFEEGGSWLNLSIGFAFLFWLFKPNK